MTEILTSVNWLAVAVGTMVYFVLGWLWYGPLFGKLWMVEMKMSEHPEPPDPKIYIYSLVLQLVGVAALGVFLTALNINTALHGMLIGLGAGLGFVFSLSGVTGLFEDRSFTLHTINNGYHVFGLAIAGAIIGAW